MSIIFFIQTSNSEPCAWAFSCPVVIDANEHPGIVDLDISYQQDRTPGVGCINAVPAVFLVAVQKHSVHIYIMRPGSADITVFPVNSPICRVSRAAEPCRTTFCDFLGLGSCNEGSWKQWYIHELEHFNTKVHVEEKVFNVTTSDFEHNSMYLFNVISYINQVHLFNLIRCRYWTSNHTPIIVVQKGKWLSKTQNWNNIAYYSHQINETAIARVLSTVLGIQLKS